MKFTQYIPSYFDGFTRRELEVDAPWLLCHLKASEFLTISPYGGGWIIAAKVGGKSFVVGFISESGSTHGPGV